LYFSSPGTPNATDLSNIGSALASYWVAEMLPLQSNALTLTQVVVTWLAVENGVQAVFGVTPVAPGGQVSAGLPGNVSLAVSFRTGLSGRSFRGRNYLAGLTEGQVTGNEISSTAAAAFVDVYEGLLPTLTALSLTHVVVSRFAGGLPRVSGVATPVVSYLTTDLVVDSQRRRLTGRGR